MTAPDDIALYLANKARPTSVRTNKSTDVTYTLHQDHDDNIWAVSSPTYRALVDYLLEGYNITPKEDTDALPASGD